MNNNKAKPYFLRDLPAELRRLLEHRAIDEGLSLPKLIIKALWAYVKGVV